MATMLVVSGIASYGVGRVCEKVFEPKRKEKEFFVDEANRAKKRFWLIYGDGEGNYKQDLLGLMVKMLKNTLYGRVC